MQSQAKEADNTGVGLGSAGVEAFRRGLLAWYVAHHREMPWRPPPGEGNAGLVDPYYSLVSEAMLQQTQVSTVLAYFDRFVGELPTVEALAGAEEQRVLRLWQGLGYYRRARNLHAAAKMVVSEYGGRVPRDVASLLKLPGVGRYTAGAIASIAHGVPAPIVDGNVARVFARVFEITEPVDRSDVVKRLWSIAEALVPERSPGDFNQALMELGALVCTPKKPGCLTCPVRGQCGAVGSGEPEALPVKLPKKKPRAVTHVVLAVGRRGKFLFEQRASTGLWSKMWQLPTWEDAPADVLADTGTASRQRTSGPRPAGGASSSASPPAACLVPAKQRLLCQWFTERFGVVPGEWAVAHEFMHQTTHRTIRFVVLRADAASGRTRAGTGRWLKLSQLDDLPLPNPQREATQHLAKDH
ncbi:MAG: A/G-specific adenine glycosylase [Phycisphaerales bacterium JB063]